MTPRPRLLLIRVENMKLSPKACATRKGVYGKALSVIAACLAAGCRKRAALTNASRAIPGMTDWR